MRPGKRLNPPCHRPSRLPTPSEARGTRHEVIDSELFKAPSLTRSHQEIVGHLFWLLYGFSREHELGQVFVSPGSTGVASAT
jgi:hypothetical protein